MARTLQEKSELKGKASQLFSPRTPINTTDFFAGRGAQILKTVNAIKQPGAHIIIYGERGAGKTSLANVAPVLYTIESRAQVVAPRINCDGTDDFGGLWRKVFAKLAITRNVSGMGLVPKTASESHSLIEEVGNKPITPGVVQEVLANFGRHCNLVVILDEFDRLPDGDVPRLVADTIKSLSDSNTPATVIIVGVGDSVANLVRGHESVRRHLVEVPLPRMSRNELEKIVGDRVAKLGMTVDDAALRLISLLSRGLPYYTHLLGQHAACTAIDADSPQIVPEHVRAAITEAIEDSEREMRRVYYEATKSRHPNNLLTQSLAACALAEKDEFGYFTAGDVREPMSILMGRPYDIPNYIEHLKRFSDKAHGGILQPTGSKHQKRYRFSDPLMEPFVILKSLADEAITDEHLKKLFWDKAS